MALASEDLTWRDDEKEVDLVPAAGIDKGPATIIIVIAVRNKTRPKISRFLNLTFLFNESLSLSQG
ncbi:MAG: hypothetical protein WA667_12745 [Candidatus Nitrosopolaris sp.]